MRVFYFPGVEVDQRPAVKEKLAASLNLQREALLPGLSIDKMFFSSGTGGEPGAAPGCSGESEATSAAAASSARSGAVGSGGVFSKFIRSIC